VNKFQIAIRKISIHFTKPIWSFIVNSVFWLFHLNKISAVRTDMRALKQMPVDVVMSMFKWKEDYLKDWTPWVSTIVYKSITDDCDGAAELAKWHFKTRGIKAGIFNLYSATEGHTICVTKDRTKMVTNERVVDLNPATWEDDIMRYFKNKYEVMF
jgi:hypothetical protein